MRFLLQVGLLRRRCELLRGTAKSKCLSAMAQSGQNHVAREGPSRIMPLERLRLAAQRLTGAQFENNENTFTALLIICQAFSSLQEKYPRRPQLLSATLRHFFEAAPVRKNALR
jgi:hypothetical protein